jgi:hypothetical protein
MAPQGVTRFSKSISFCVEMKVNFHFHNMEAIITPSSTINYPLQMCRVQILVFLDKISAHQTILRGPLIYLFSHLVGFCQLFRHMEICP